MTIVSLPFFLSIVSHFSPTALQDTDSDPDVYARPAPSSESLGPPGVRSVYPESATPTYMEYAGPTGAQEAYPAWSSDRQIPLSKEEIEDIFLDLTQKFGFQRDSMRNMVCRVSYSLSWSGSVRLDNQVFLGLTSLTKSLIIDCPNCSINDANTCHIVRFPNAATRQQGISDVA